MRTSDRYQMLLAPVQFHGMLVELAKLWAGAPMSGSDYGTGEHLYLDAGNPGLRAYVENLMHCFRRARW